MKIALCTERIIPIGKRQDGFHPLSARDRYDIIKEIEVNADAEVVLYQGDYYIDINESIADSCVFKKAVYQEIE